MSDHPQVSKTSLDRLRIKPLVGADDYDLWRIRITAVLDDAGLLDVVQESAAAAASSSESSAVERGRTEEDDRCKRANAIIVTALGDNALQVVASVHGRPAQIMTKLDERYNSKSMAAKISRMAEFVSLHYTDRTNNIATHIDRMASLVAKLKSMSLPIDDTMAIGVLVASIKVASLAPVVAAIKTIPASDMTWDTVASRLIEDWGDLPKPKYTEEGASYTAQVQCEFCGRNGHTEGDCKFMKKFLERQDDDDKQDKKPSKKSQKSTKVRHRKA